MVFVTFTYKNNNYATRLRPTSECDIAIEQQSFGQKVSQCSSGEVWRHSILAWFRVTSLYVGMVHSNVTLRLHGSEWRHSTLVWFRVTSLYVGMVQSKLKGYSFHLWLFDIQHDFPRFQRSPTERHVTAAAAVVMRRRVAGELRQLVARVPPRPPLSAGAVRAGYRLPVAAELLRTRHCPVGVQLLQRVRATARRSVWHLANQVRYEAYDPSTYNYNYQPCQHVVIHKLCILLLSWI